MANSFLTPSVIARTALGLLQRELVLGRLVWRDAEPEFNGKIGDTVTVRVPASLTARDYEWRTRNADIVTDDVTEAAIAVALDTHVYHAAAVTDEELTLDIVEFGSQVLVPQVRAVAERVEDKIAAVMQAVNAEADDVDFDGDPAKAYKVAVQAAKALNDLNVPRADRVLLVGSALEAAMLESDKLSNVNTSGTDSALRDGVVGRVAGFTVVGSNAVDEDFGLAFHPSAFIFASRAPGVPEGATYGESMEFDGSAMRWLRDYDANRLRDRSIVSAFCGVKSVEEGAEGSQTNRRAVRISGTSASA